MPAETETRQKRQDAILEILQQQSVARQTELVTHLQDRGINATQSSVSRDLKQLGITKLNQGYVQPQITTTNNGMDLTAIGELVREIETAGANLTVIKTAIGAAQRVAVYLDRSEWTEIVGTLSGDDTIFVATRSANEQRRLVTKLHAQFSS
jgi:transcriptional regulator of arginine metabolism